MTRNAFIRFSMFITGVLTIALIATDMQVLLPDSQSLLTPTFSLEYVTITPDLNPVALQPTTAPPTLTPADTEAVPTLTLSPQPEATAQPVATLPPEALAANTSLHTVATGDNLYRIAQIYEVPMEAIIAVNNLLDPSRLYIGQTILIPDADVPLAMIPTALPQMPTVPANSAIALAATAGPSPTYSPPPGQVNGVAVEQIVLLPDAVRQHIREVFAHGQSLGNNPRAFSKLGDSTIENPFFLARFDGTEYNLGDYRYLQSVIDYFDGSFERQSVAVRRGLHSWSVFNPTWADKAVCQPNETLIACEFRLNRPSVLLIRLGTNDVGIPDSFDENLREIVAFSLENSVIPVLGTKADRFEGANNINNTIIRQVATDYQVPLWDFDRVAETIPGKGLDQDNVHLTTFYAHDYTSPTAFQRGHSVHNLTALLVLDAIWQAVRPAGT